MKRRRHARLRAVLFVAALYYLVALPVGYVGAAIWLDCGHFGCGRAVKRSPRHAIRSAIMLYVADNPRECPTSEALVEERYLAAIYAADFEIRCDEGDFQVIGPWPPASPLRERWRRRACRTLDLGTEIWVLPFRAMSWTWRAAAELFV